MIVKVFDKIYISNVYNANEIYQLIKLNIGGVLTCFGCKSIEWCHHNADEKHKVFYKDKFINCKSELLRNINDNFVGDEHSNDIPANSRNDGNAVTLKCNDDCNDGDEKNTDHTTPSHLRDDSQELVSSTSAHYDYIVYPYEILNSKLDNSTINDYVKAMLHLSDDTEIDYVVNAEESEIDYGPTKRQRDLDNEKGSTQVKGEEVKALVEEKDDLYLCKDEKVEECPNDNNQNEKNEKLCRIMKSKDVLKEQIAKEDLPSEPVSYKDNSKEDAGREAATGSTSNAAINGATEGMIQNVCELNKSLREKEKTVSINNIYKMKHMYINILDTFDENILDHIENAHAFIDDIISENKNILVHCMAGISRCSSIILSYVSKKNKKGINKNLSILKSKYPFAHPNENFYRQLLLYEKMNYTLDGSTEFHNAYKKIKFDRKFLEDLKLFNLKNEKEPTYKFRCKFCRYALFSDNDIIEHDLDKCKIKKNYGNCCTSIFIEKKEWLLTEGTLKGVLYCPNANCNIKLGKWSWNGICCSCGYLQIPAFMVNTSNVDRMRINTI
ncbi:dual specificity protein phosphatase, putative [Plasmodium malariae]|uniref:protein-tyrosine-phosphatase n=1 Tax=Plasmodium malariae TaxID=5858 RepID=A0A1D3PBB9_PLAMA|nr:dual specificity protein phosphatase, putative [Plasmodium malariae]SCN12344.1 dual specificity protein phosphatase, putative [Plasmodium malariae]